MTLLTRLLNRAAALLLLALVLGVIWILAVQPLVARLAATSDAIEHNRQLIGKLSRSIGGDDAQDAIIEGLTESIAASGQYLNGATEPLAAAEIQQLLIGVLDSESVDVKSFQALPSTEALGLTRINVRVVLQGEYDAIIAAMYELETGEPQLFIEDLRLKMAAMRRGLREDQQPPPVSVVFQVSGYMPPGAGS